MDHKNFGQLNVKPLVDDLVQKLDDAATKLQNEGQEAGEAFGRGWDDGLDSTVEKIKASSIKMSKAFSNLAEKLRKQVQQLTTNVNGKDFKLKIDFSDIDMNADDIKQKVAKIFKDFTTEGLIEFDAKGSEQQFKNLITLYVKYQEKLNALQGVAPNLTSSKEIELNLRQQLMLALKLKEIYSFLDGPSPIKGYSMEINKISNQLATVQKVIKQTQGDDTKVTGDYDELAKVLKEIQGSLKVISNTFKNENNSMKAMADSGVTSFTSLSQAIIEVYNNLTQVQSLVDTISQKDFNVTNITQTGGDSSNLQALTQQMTVARDTMEHLRQLYDQAGDTLQGLGSKGEIELVIEYSKQLQELNLTDIGKSVKKADTEMKLASVIAEMQDYIDKLIQINELRNKFNLGEWKDSFVPTQKPVVKPVTQSQPQTVVTPTVIQTQEVVGDTEALQMVNLKGAVDEVSKAIGRKNAGFIKEKEIVDSSVSAEEAKLRELVGVITNEIGLALDNIKVKFVQSFVVPELDKNNLQTSFDEIYNKFIELKDKIQTMKIDIGINTANITMAIQEALYAKEIAVNYKTADFYDLFKPDLFDFGQYIDMFTGETVDKSEAKQRYAAIEAEGTTVFVNKLGTVIGTMQDVIQDIVSKSSNTTSGVDAQIEENNWAQVIVEAINTQGGRIVESIKLLIPKNITDTVDESKLIEAFAVLTSAINNAVENNIFYDAGGYFKDILNGGGIPDPDVANALVTLGLMSSSGQKTFTMPSVGGSNSGIALGKDLVYNSIPTEQIGDVYELMEKQNKAYEMGAQVARIIAAYESDDTAFRLETKLQGRNFRRDPEDAGVWDATDEQIDRLLHTFEALEKAGLVIEFGGDNVLYDKDKGFSLVDIAAEKAPHHWDDQDTAEGMLKSFARHMNDIRPYDADSSAKKADLMRRFEERSKLRPEQRLVNANTIAAEKARQAQQTSGVNTKVTPTMDEGAIAKLVEENVAKTPATVKVTPVVDSASNTEQAVDGESQSAADAARQFIEAANAKKEFVDANKLVAESAKESADAVKQESEAIDSIDVEISADSFMNPGDSFIKAETEAHEANTKAIKEETEAEKELARVKDVYDNDDNLKGHEDVYKYKEGNALVEEKVAQNIMVDDDGNEVRTIITTIIKDFEKFNKEEKKTEENIARAQSKLDEFVKKFKSKTGGNAQFIEGFNEISNFKINKDNIEEAFNLMTNLQARYNELEGNFRKGQASLNPFTNAINKAANIDNIFGDVEYKFNALVNKSKELTDQFTRLQELSKSIKAFVEIINTNPDAITPESFNEFSKQVGEFNLLKTQIDGVIKKEKRAESDDMVSFRRLVQATKARDSYTEKAAKEKDGSDWKGYYSDRAAEQQGLIDSIRAGVTLTEEQESELNALSEKHALILKDINLENNKIEEQKQKYEEIMRLLAKNQTEQAGLDSGSLKVVDKEAYQQRLNNERAQIESLIGGADLNPQQTKSVQDLVKLIADLRLESSNIDLMSKKWTEQNILTDEAKAKIEALRQSLLKVTSGIELDLWKKQWKELANEMSMANIDAKEDKKIGKLIEDDRVAKVKEYINLLKLQQDYEKKAAKEDNGSKMQSFYNEQVAKVKEKINQIDINAIANQEEKNKLLALEEAHQRAIAEILAKKNVGGQKSTMPFGTEDEKVQKKYEAGYLSDGLYNDWQKELAEYRNYMTGVTQADETTIQEKKQHLIQLYDALTKMSNASKSFFASGGEILPKEMWFNEDEVNDMSTSLMKLYNNISSERFEGMTTSVTRLKPELGKLFFTVDDGNGSLSQYVIHVNQATGATKLLADSTKPTLTVLQRFGQTLKKDFTGLLTAVMGGTSIHTFVQYMRQGINSVRELDLALTELKKVTDETEETYERFLDTAAKTGARIGSTLRDVTSATAEFAKLGYNIEQAASMAESALVYTNVGDNVDVETGSQSIISTMKAFGIEANNTMSIVDKFNEIGNNFAITTKGIGDALQVSASAMAAAGNSLDETIALTTAANTIVQNPNTVGTALKTLSLRIRGVKTE